MKKSSRMYSEKLKDAKLEFSMILLFCCTIFLIFGCSGNALEPLADDSSNEAKIEEARIALNDENYEEARSILEGMNLNSAKARAYLANALSGLAGLDTFRLLESIEDINDSESSGSIDLVGTILDEDGDSMFNKEELMNKIDLFSDAISAMLGKYKKDKTATGIVMALDIDLEDVVAELEDLTSDMTVQLGLLGLNHAVLTIAQIIMEDLNLDTITLTETWIKTNLPESSVWVLKETENLENLLKDISVDLNLLSKSVDELIELIGLDSEDSNDLKEHFEDFLDELGSTDVDGNRTLTKSELEAYINSL